MRVLNTLNLSFLAEQDYFILSEMEAAEATGKDPELGWQAAQRLSALSGSLSRRTAARVTADSQQMEQSLLKDSMQSPAGRRRSSIRAVKRDSLTTAGSLGPIHRRTSSIDMLPSMSLPTSFTERLPGSFSAHGLAEQGPSSVRGEAGMPPRAAQPHAGQKGASVLGREAEGPAAIGSSTEQLSQGRGGSVPSDVEMASLRSSTGTMKQTYHL